MDFKKHKIFLTDRQLKKLKGRYAVLLTKEQLKEDGPIELHMRKNRHKKLSHNISLGKGFKLHPDDFDMEGGNIKEFLSNVGTKAKQLYTEHVKPVIGPKIRQNIRPALNTLVDYALTAIETAFGIPEAQVVNAGITMALRPGIEYVAKKIEEFGDYSGAYGIGGRKKKNMTLNITMSEMPPLSLPTKKKGKGVADKMTHPHHLHPSLPPTETHLFKPMYQ